MRKNSGIVYETNITDGEWKKDNKKIFEARKGVFQDTEKKGRSIEVGNNNSTPVQTRKHIQTEIG